MRRRFTRSRRMRKRTRVTPGLRNQLQKQKCYYAPTVSYAGVGTNYDDCTFGQNIILGDRLNMREDINIYMRGVRLEVNLEHLGFTNGGEDYTVLDFCKDIYMMVYVLVNARGMDTHNTWFLSNDMQPLAFDDSGLNDRDRMTRRVNRRDLQILWGKKFKVSSANTNDGAGRRSLYYSTYVPINRKIHLRCGSSTTTPLTLDQIHPLIQVVNYIMIPETNPVLHPWTLGGNLETISHVRQVKTYWYYNET